MKLCLPLMEPLLGTSSIVGHLDEATQSHVSTSKMITHFVVTWWELGQEREGREAVVGVT